MVYINKKTSQSLYMHKPLEKVSSNQEVFRKTPLHELLKQQNMLRDTLSNASNEINDLVSDSKKEQVKLYSQIIKELENHKQQTAPLIDNAANQEVMYRSLLNRFIRMEEINHQLLKRFEDDEFINQGIIDQLTFQDTAIKQLSIKIEQYGGLQNNLTERIDEQTKINEDILKTLELQEAFHTTVLERLENQEAHSQKLSRDIDHLKSTLHERISFVVEKIEDHYRQIISFVTHLFTKRSSLPGPTTNKEEKQKEIV